MPPFSHSLLYRCLWAGLLLPTTTTSAWSEATLPTVNVYSDDAPLAGSPRDGVSTATRTDTPLRDVPATVSVVSGTLVREQEALDLNTAMRNVAGVQPHMGGGYGFADNYVIRGLPMRFLRDGLLDGATQNGYWRTLRDVERVEVLKGPGSAMYGGGQAGGTINLVTREPSEAFFAEAGAIVGSHGTKGVFADVSHALGAGLSGRFIANIDDTSGYRGLARDIKEISPSLRWAYHDGKVVSMRYDHREIHVTPDNYGKVFDATGQLAKSPRDARYYSPMNFSDQTIDRITLTHDWRLTPSLVMRSALIHDERSLNLARNALPTLGGNAAGRLPNRSIRPQNDDSRLIQARNEAVWQVTTGALQHTVLAGVDYMHSKVDTERTGAALPDIENINAPQVVETQLSGLRDLPAQAFRRRLSQRSTGIYLQDQIAFGDTLKVRAAYRHDNYQFSDVGTVAARFRSLGTGMSQNGGSLGVVWQPTLALSVYAGVSTSKFVNVSTEVGSIPSLPESALQKELGVKTEWFDSRLHLNAALFETTRRDYYITLPGASAPTPDGSDRSRGIELEIGARPNSAWSVTANLSLLDATVQSDVLASNAVLGVPNRSIAGTRPTGVARTAASVWTYYALDAHGLTGWSVGSGVTMKGDAFADSLNLYRVPGYVVLDAAVRYRQRHWDIALKINNIADKTYYSTPTFIGALPGAPRGALLTARYRFH